MSPAALFGQSTGTTDSDILRLYTASMTTATSMAAFYHDSSTFTGAGLLMDMANGGGSFTGNFVDFRYQVLTRFVMTAAGTTTIGQTGQTVNAAGLNIGFGGLCVDLDGTCNASTTCRISAREYTTGATDLAELYYSSEGLETGDIVAAKGKSLVGKAATGTDPVIGVVSTKPGMILGLGESKTMDLHDYPIGLVGRIPAKLSTENGAINIGDKIILSSV